MQATYRTFAELRAALGKLLVGDATNKAEIARLFVLACCFRPELKKAVRK